MTTDAALIPAMYRSTAQELTEPLRAFLGRQHVVTLATHNADGSVHLTPTWFLFEDGRFLIATWSRSRKARNAAARPDVTVLVDDRDTAEWVSATGTAELIRGTASARVNDRLHRRYMTEAGLDAVGPLFAHAENVSLAITPRRWAAWDYQSTMLTALADAGAAVGEAHAWFRP